MCMWFFSRESHGESRTTAADAKHQLCHAMVCGPCGSRVRACAEHAARARAAGRAIGVALPCPDRILIERLEYAACRSLRQACSLQFPTREACARQIAMGAPGNAASGVVHDISHGRGNRILQQSPRTGSAAVAASGAKPPARNSLGHGRLAFPAERLLAKKHASLRCARRVLQHLSPVLPPRIGLCQPRPAGLGHDAGRTGCRW
jgi:hypothetical protein